MLPATRDSIMARSVTSLRIMPGRRVLCGATWMSPRISPGYDGACVETRQALAPREDGTLACRAYTASDYIEGFSLVGLEAEDVAGLCVRNWNGRYEIHYGGAPQVRRDGRPYWPASTWPLTPTVFTPQSDFVITLRRPMAPQEGAQAPLLLIYDVYVTPESHIAATRYAAEEPACIGEGYQIVPRGDAYGLLDPSGRRVDQFAQLSDD